MNWPRMDKQELTQLRGQRQLEENMEATQVEVEGISPSN